MSENIQRNCLLQNLDGLALQNLDLQLRLQQQDEECKETLWVESEVSESGTSTPNSSYDSSHESIQINTSVCSEDIITRSVGNFQQLRGIFSPKAAKNKLEEIGLIKVAQTLKHDELVEHAVEHAKCVSDMSSVSSSSEQVAVDCANREVLLTQSEDP